MSAAPCRLWLIGCGNMAGAMLRRWLDAGTLQPADVFVVNRGDRDLPVPQGRRFPDGPLPDAVMLGMKPQQLGEVAAMHGARIAGVSLLISILAGADEAALAARFDAGAIVRAMPNLPVAIGKGVVVMQSAAGPIPAAAALMVPLGLVEWVDAATYNIAGSLSGCGPAYTYRFVDALATAGAQLGLPRAQAERLALATVEGAGLLAAGAAEPPATLADRVASPQGSTREGLNVLDADRALARLLTETLAASVRRNAEMAAAARHA